MAKITECKHCFLFIYTGDDEEGYLKAEVEYFNNVEDMLNRIDEMTLERAEQNKPWARHFDYDYIYFF